MKSKLLTGNLKMPVAIAAMAALLTTNLQAMHITEGFLPPTWAIGWWVLYLPFLVWGVAEIKRRFAEDAGSKILLAMAGAFCFLLSALKLPSVAGSSSHPTGIGLGTVLFGAPVMSVIGLVVLLFQAGLLAHGGVTTLGANGFSMSVAGPFAGILIFKLTAKTKLPMAVRVFLTAAVADLFTYVVTSGQLALVYNSDSVSMGAAFGKFLSIFAITQIPIAIVEGIFTALIYKAIVAVYPAKNGGLTPALGGKNT